MRTSSLLPALLVACGGLAACTANIHDNVVNIPDATVNATTNVDVDNVTPEQMVPMAVEVKHVYLIDPSMTPPADHVSDAGHLQVYLDDTSNPPLLVTAQTNIMVKIPKEAKSGHHKLICRVHKHDGAPTSTQFELSITVKVTVTNAPAADASVPMTEKPSTPDAAATDTN